MTPALTLLGWADITQLLNQVVHARSQPDTLPLYVPTESVARVREVQAALNESLVQMPGLEPVRLADQFPEVGEMVGRTCTRDDVIAAAQAVGMPDLWLACFADSLLDYIGKMLDAAALRPAAQPTMPAGWKLVPVEPTPEMGEAYLAAAKIHAAYGRENVMRFSVGGYQAMLSAAPAAQPSEQWETSPKDGEQWETSPMGGEQWQTVPFAQPVGEPVGVVCGHESSYHKSQLSVSLLRFVKPGTNLYAAPQPAAVPDRVPMTPAVFDLICAAIDKADTISMEGDYMLDSDDCINVVRTMQALIDVCGVTAPNSQPTRTE